MDQIDFERHAARIVEAQKVARFEGRFCPFACRSANLVCVGRNGTDSRRISAVDEDGVVFDVSPYIVSYIKGCPVVRFPDKKTIEISGS